MEEGTILRWLLGEGDPVRTETLLFELETDKAIIEVPSPAMGFCSKSSRTLAQCESKRWLAGLATRREPWITAATQKTVEAPDQPNPVAHGRAPLKHAPFDAVNARRAKPGW